jgi:hypothetical protein
MTKFVLELSSLVKESGTISICALVPSEQRLFSTLSSLAEGIIEMKLEEDKSGAEGISRSVRLLSAKGRPHKLHWVNFKISDTGELIFSSNTYYGYDTSLTCTLCGKSISGRPIMDSNLAFDSRACMETYKRLADAYGSNISQTGCLLKLST